MLMHRRIYYSLHMLLNGPLIYYSLQVLLNGPLIYYSLHMLLNGPYLLQPAHAAQWPSIYSNRKISPPTVIKKSSIMKFEYFKDLLK